jgi:translation initiation factor IF-2
MIKYRVTDVAKDFGVSSKEIVELLAQHFQPAKKSATALEEVEVDVIFEHYTQKYNPDN